MVDTWTSARGARIHGPQLLDAMIDVADGRVPEPAPHLPAELELHQFGQRIIGTIELLKRRQFSGKQKTQGAMRMTALGESLNQAFGPRHRKPGLSQFGSVPVYRDQSDERYTRIISRYSSLGMLPEDPYGSTTAFMTTHLHMQNDWAYSLDPSFPLAVKLRPGEADFLSDLTEFTRTIIRPGVDRDMVSRLYREGLIGLD